jgi:hypothetical protein
MRCDEAFNFADFELPTRGVFAPSTFSRVQGSARRPAHVLVIT